MKIEKYLALNKYFLSLFGVKNFGDLQKELANKKEVISEGRSHFVNVLCSLDNLKISEDELFRYDTNIQSYVRKISYRREPISLKYFQYLAVLFAEIFLDNLKHRKTQFINELNEFLQSYEDGKLKYTIGKFNEENENELKKLAFWMATGSGKTLISHINYYQFFNYKLFEPDHIIFITPNEGLSKQHFEELQKSGIPARLYGGSLNGGLKSEREVLVIEMTKFVEEKKGGGVTLPVNAFEGKSLVFVDEGHKGRKSDEQKWAKLRDKLAEKGFVFEYSATFGQILSEKNEETLKEYSKAIIFDYSYKYFYLDGYGKDFSVINVEQVKISEREFQETMFVANLLSFYEQLLLYEEKNYLAREHNLQKPLWIFVGTTVTGREEEPDVIQIVEFIKRIIDEQDWVKKITENILNGNSKFKDENNQDIFSDRFEYLKKRGLNFDDLYLKIFGEKGSLKIHELKNVEGELGLKISESPYFGVISIGDVSGFKKLLEARGISVEQDAISFSLFDDIKREGSKINILIGSKKFIEGWDTWRVSSMGLLNIGKGQGPQIIQLFGRGIRIKGKGMSLKRSEDTVIRPLETLNIYGIKADYLNTFLDAIRKEEVEFEEIKIPVKPVKVEQWSQLPYLKKDDIIKFNEEKVLSRLLDSNIYFTLDLLPKVSMFIGKERKYVDSKGKEIAFAKTEVESEPLEHTLPKVVDIDLLDWERILEEVYDFRSVREYWNLVWDKESLKTILIQTKVRALPETFEIKKREDLRKLEDIAILLIKGYIDRFYRKYRGRFETNTLKYTAAGEQLKIFVSEKPVEYYTIQVDKMDKEGKKLIEEIKEIIVNIDKLLKDDERTLPRLTFDYHIYIPCLLDGVNIKIRKISPSGLVVSEKKFVKGLREYLENNKEKFSNIEIYLLRNEVKSEMGIGFRLEWASFYPDFIMWVKTRDKQIMVFIDPKGLHHTKGLDDEKIIFARFPKSDDEITIKTIEKKLGQNIILESFILSDTKHEELIKGSNQKSSIEEYIGSHVLFLDDSGWPEKLFRELGI